MLAPHRRRAARTTAGAAALGITAVLAAGAPAAGGTGPEPPPPAEPAQVLQWPVELKGTWSSPTWAQAAGRTTVVVELDCGNPVGARPPQYYVQLMPHDRMVPMVMPQPVPCGVPHALTGDQLAGTYHVFLAKASGDGAVLRGKVEVATP
ncbi:hypothetical protein [Cellulomonas wangsupingiae]|uniref:Secreted protein n=1 Tax=Cellulomonas wangsupingiae TaxID=2968085 RepID=A0ABY5K9Q7_9CELL|nr:hypothetical protein [Cellulomonas wangsupingiae]MCC2334135.1 hypothetical protein [Cellulomonas wangsupingiae]UUI65815.1 hypothetical protein NP075_03530 [Cellulomonas wangsupingiae]